MLARRSLLLLPLSALAACSGPLNNEPGIGNAGRPFGHSIYTPATLTDGPLPPPPEGLEPTTDQARAPVYTAAGPVAASEASPSLITLDRSGWSATPMHVPSDFPAHQPRFAGNYIIQSTDPRAQGRYPNERAALGVGSEQHNDEQIVEAFAAPFVAGADVVLLIPRIIAESRPAQPTRTGGEGYVRTPGQVVIVNPPLEVTGEATRIGGLPTAPIAPVTPSKVPGIILPTTRSEPVPAAPAPAPAAPPVPPAAQPPAQPAPAPAPANAAPPATPPAPSDPAAVPAKDLKPGGGMPASDLPRR